MSLGLFIAGFATGVVLVGLWSAFMAKTLIVKARKR